MGKNLQEIVHKINFFSFSFVTVISLSLSAEIIRENDWADKIDDIVMAGLAIVGIIWYKKKGYKSTSVLGSLVIFLAAMLTKVGAIMIEHADSEAVGDDMGILITLIFGLVFVFWMIWQKKKLKT